MPRKPRRGNDRSRDKVVSDRDRDRHRDERTFFNRPPSPSRYAPPSLPPPSFDYRRNDHDSWRPPPPRDLPPPPPPPPLPRSFHGDSRATDSYRPRPPQGDFTFRAQHPSGPAPSFAPVNNYPPTEPRRFRRDDRGRGGRRGRGRWQPPPHPSERALVTGAGNNLPEEQVNGTEANGVAKFRALDELSDDDELDMEISSRSSQSDQEEPSTKRAKTNASTADGNAAPKWSNPDPYTALPCPDDSLQKKRDVVKLIRKARVDTAEAKKSSKPVDTEDFISFDLTSSEDEDGDDQDNSTAQTNGHTRSDQSGPLGSRKRTVDDEIKRPDYGQLKKVNMKPGKGLLVAAWQAKSGEDPCPWATVDHSQSHDMAFRLHKEILDFYNHVRPRQYEERIRRNLVDNIQNAMRRDGRNFASAEVRPFGSFMSGLYLPTADMDLVVCSASFLRGGPPTYLSAKSWLYKFQKMLTAQRVADADSIEVIAHARIPLVKFVDRVTGLKVDISFENLGGVDAIDTFLHWKSQYPAMPILVTVIKHFLLMRGLNEPVNGGIGGFSVICLVVSMLQNMPQVQSRSLIPEHHLGEMLLEFLDLYGRHFQYENVAISLRDPVGYIHKGEVVGFTYKNRNRLSIIDPNNYGNDISGGSSNTSNIVARFEDAYDLLRERMLQVSKSPKDGGILDVILRGDYSSFRQQRKYLKHIHETTVGACSDD